MKLYDAMILGGGPAGYAAAMYAARAGLETLVLEKLSAGGQMALTAQIDNYPGFDEGVDGFSLGEKMKKGAERFGVTSVLAEATEANLTGRIKTVRTAQGEFSARTLMIATGAAHRPLGLDREQALTGRGVSACAACDGMFYRNRVVAVVGGGNTAAADALLLSRICKRVLLIHWRDALRADKIYRDALKGAENVTFLPEREIAALIGAQRLSGLEVRNVRTGEREAIEVDGLFVAIGRQPETALFQGQLALDAQGYIIADETTRTSVEGVFAVGDVRTKPVRQIVTAAADGAVAAHFAEEYLAGLALTLSSKI